MTQTAANGPKFKFKSPATVGEDKPKIEMEILDTNNKNKTATEKCNL